MRSIAGMVGRVTRCMLAVGVLGALIPADLAAGADGTLNGNGPPHENGPLNVIVVLVDDLGWADLSCQGSEWYRTPHADRLAERGVRFTSGYAACAVCSPTRAAYMTGRYPARLGITDWIRATWNRGGIQKTLADRPAAFQSASDKPLLCPRNPFWMDHQEVTLAEQLAAAGYVTAHIGKWHLGDELWEPTSQGFAFNVAGCDFGHPPSYFDPFQRTDQQGRTWQIAHLPPREAGEYLTDREADEAVQFIRAHQDQPFFLSLCHYAVHTPIQAKPELAAQYQPLAAKASLQRNADYGAMIHSVDEALGRVLDVLDELHLFEQTMVIFTSDNGGLIPITNNHPLRDGKGTPYEGGIRVPWIVHLPGVSRPGTVIDTPIITCDIKPTVLDALQISATDPSTIDGVSLLGLLKQGTPPPRALFWHFPHYRLKWTPYAIIRKGPHKLIRWFEDDRCELYHLGEDIGEEQDLASQSPEQVQVLNRELDAWLANVGARLPRPNPPQPNSAAPDGSTP